MINELVVFNTYGLLVPAKLIIHEAADTHLVYFQGFVHFKDLEIRGPLCNLNAFQSRMDAWVFLGIPVVAWLTDDKITL